jgi:hypothetical protein
MKPRRVYAIAVGALLLLASPVFGQDEGESGLTLSEAYEMYIDVDTQIADLARWVQDGESIESDRLYVLVGTVANLYIYPEPPFTAEFDLVSAAWEGVSVLRESRAFVIAQFPDFEPLFVADEPAIQDKTEIVVVAEYYDVIDFGNGVVRPAVIAQGLRPLR